MKKFIFFEKQLVKEPGKNEAKLDIKKIPARCACSGRGQIVLGDELGNIFIIDREYNISKSWSAYASSVDHMEISKHRNILVTIGNDEEKIAPTLKIWNLDVWNVDEPEMLRIEKISNMLATVCAINQDLTQIAVGLGDGTVIVIAGDPLRDRYSTTHETKIPGDSPVTGLHFIEHNRKSNLFVVTSNSIITFESSMNALQKIDVLDRVGCGLACNALSPENELIIGLNDALYFYKFTEGKGPGRPLEGVRKLVTTFRNYVVVVDISNNNKYNTLTIYDSKNKFTAYSSTFPDITQVFSEWGNLFVLSRDGSLHRLIEHDTQTKLDTLFRRSQFQVAIDMALSNHYDSNAIVDIFRRYGDHLYDKGDYERAMEQYLKTIGYEGLEPSYVIKQFLDAQRIQQLTTYLSRLHEAGYANANHTTLLLNCYAKLKDEAKLDEFIAKPDIKFDVETAIKVCRQAGYNKRALNLARKHKAHVWYIKILLELNEGKEALEYIQSLPFLEAEANLKKYGKDLVSALPEETTNVLMNLCTNYVPKGKGAEAYISTQRAVADQFIHIYVDHPKWLINFLEFILDKGLATQTIYNTLLELYLRHDEKEDYISPEIKREKAMTLLKHHEAKYDDGHALVLCQMHEFKQGQLYLYEKMGLYNEIVQHHMDYDEYDKVVSVCKKYAKSDTNLWMKTLSYLLERDLRQEVLEVLSYVEKHGLLPPMQVVKLLSQPKNTTLDIARNYIVEYLQKEQKEIINDTRQMKKHQEETKKNKEEIFQLKTEAKIFQQKECSRCTTTLDLPAVHFLCNHTFHQRCLSENESECPECGDEYRDFKNRQKGLEQSSKNDSEFFRQLEISQNGFSVVAKYFGRGLFNKPTQQLETVELELPSLDGFFVDLT